MKCHNQVVAQVKCSLQHSASRHFLALRIFFLVAVNVEWLCVRRFSRTDLRPTGDIIQYSLVRCRHFHF